MLHLELSSVPTSTSDCGHLHIRSATLTAQREPEPNTGSLRRILLQMAPLSFSIMSRLLRRLHHVNTLRKDPEETKTPIPADSTGCKADAIQTKHKKICCMIKVNCSNCSEDKTKN